MHFIHCKEYDSSQTIGGSVKYAELLDQGLKNNGNKTITYYRGAIYAGRTLSIKQTPRNRLNGFYGLVREVFKSWIQSKPKIWIVHHPVMGSVSLLARKKKLIYICHGPWAEEAKDIGNKNITMWVANATRNLLQKALFKRSDEIFFLSNYMKSRVEECLGIRLNKQSNVRLIPPIVSVTNSKKRGNDSDLKRICGQIYICRRLVKRTGVSEFFEKLALSSIKNQFSIIVAGDGPERKLIETTISSNNLENCKLFGFVNENNHNRNFLQSEFMLLPSLRNEGFGLVIIEAISNECIPIISINAGGGAEWISKLCPALIYDGSMDSMLHSISFARKNRFEILRCLKYAIKQLNKESAAMVVEKACENCD